MDFQRAISDTIARSITANDSSSTEEAAPTCSDDVPDGVLSGEQDAAGADQRQYYAKSEGESTAAVFQDQATSYVDAVDEDADSASTELF